VAGAAIGAKIAEFEAARLKLSPEAAVKQKKAYEIGLALALCGGGAAIAGTTYSSGRNVTTGERQLGQTLFLFFQKAVHPLGQLPPGLEEANSALFARALSRPLSMDYRGSPQARTDAETVRREGAPAAQAILMRFERDAMQRSIEEIRQMLPSLGSRAEPALRMLEAMYSSRITGTASLSYETLLQMGYITQLFGPSKP
jgi:hypothetical protein